ncbi:MAG: single-stranded DNA-binding protein [Candidatus Sericytochromatia bacterium]|nr:single-stranded DNA-binding protein [Candidatus Sericytochromatia bacterium]
MSVNQIVLVGSVDTDAQGVPHRGTTPTGYDLTRFRIRVAKPSRNEQDAPRFDLFSVEAVGRQAEVAAQLKPGSLVAVEGRLKTFRDEQNATRVFIEAASVQAIGASGAMPAGAPSQAAPEMGLPAASRAPVPAADGDPWGGGEPDFDGPYPF